MLRIGVYGAGGNGREAMQMLYQNLQEAPSNDLSKFLFIETNPSEQIIDAVDVVSEEQFLNYSVEDTFFNVSISDPNVRKSLASRLIEMGFKTIPIVSSFASISKSSVVGISPIISQFSLISTNVRIGDFVHINYFASISHDVELGNFVSIGPGARINGYTKIESSVIIGSQASIKPGTAKKPRIIGEGAIIGMGAVVVTDVEPFSIVVGNPAKPIKKFNN